MCAYLVIIRGKKKSFYKEKGFLFLPGYLIKECSKFFNLPKWLWVLYISPNLIQNIVIDFMKNMYLSNIGTYVCKELSRFLSCRIIFWRENSWPTCCWAIQSLSCWEKSLRTPNCCCWDCNVFILPSEQKVQD